MTSPFGPADFAEVSGVSRETLARLKIYAGMLADWNSRHNLVAAATLPDIWRRHLWDSAQLLRLVPAEALSLVDLGSGAGFPGLVLAELLRFRPVRIVLYEATGKKGEFLQAVIDRLELNAEVRKERIEQADPEPFDIITARACARLTKLLSYAHRFFGPQSICLFLKGQNVEAELTDARKFWNISTHRHESLSDSSGAILEIRELNPLGPRQSRR